MKGAGAGPGDPLPWRWQGTRVLAAVLVWTLATSLGLGTAATTRIGPVLLRLTAHHGVHAGDVIAFVLAYAAATVITLRLLTDLGDRDPVR